MIKLNPKPKTASPTKSPMPKYTLTPMYISVGNPPTNPPVPVPTPLSVAPTNPPCTETPNWVDVRGDGCDWYKLYDKPGCKLYGDTEGENGSGFAIDNCCYCSQLTNPPVPVPNPPCPDTPNWVDVRGDGCDWYKLYNKPGCELYGDTEGENGSGFAIDNCCYCSHQTHVDNPPTNPPELIPPLWPIADDVATQIPTSLVGNPPPKMPVPVNTPWPVVI